MSVFYAGDKVMIRGGIYDGYKGIVNRWVHDDWYIVNVVNSDFERLLELDDNIEIMLNSAIGEMVKA